MRRVPSSTPVALAPVWVMLSQSINTYSATSVPLLGTSPFGRRAVYVRCCRCAGAPRRPRSGSVLSLPFCLNMSPSATPGSSAAAGTQFLRRRRWPSSRRETTRHFHHFPQSASRGAISELDYGSLALRPVELFAPLADLTKHLCSANGGFYFRASAERHIGRESGGSHCSCRPCC